MRWLKAAVVIMGVMIIAMLVTIVVTIFRRITAPKPPATATAVPGPVVSGTDASPAATDVTLPAGAVLKEVTGAGDRIVLHLVGADGQERLLLIDPATGRVATTVTLVPGTQVPGTVNSAP